MNVALVIDVYSRRIVGWRVSKSLRRDLAHAVGSHGDSYNNALAESVIGLFKTEVIRPARTAGVLGLLERILSAAVY